MDTNDPVCHQTFQGSVGYKMPKGKNNIISTIYNYNICFKISPKTSQLFINYNFNKY